MKRFLSLLTVGAALLATQWACDKEDDRDYALDVIVTVNDTIRAANTLVHIYAPVDNSFIDYYEYTNEEGMVSIELKNKAVVEIVASKYPNKGCTFAELDRGVTTTYLHMKHVDNENNGCRDNQ